MQLVVFCLLSLLHQTQASQWHQNWWKYSPKAGDREAFIQGNDGKHAVKVVKAKRAGNCNSGIRPGKLRRFISQVGQDEIIFNAFFKKDMLVCSGTVVEIGANDGVYISNSLWYEKNLNWKSICVEANPKLI